MVELQKSDGSPHFITKVEGLSEVGIRIIRYNPVTNVVVIAYTNSNLDLYFPENGKIINLPFINKNPNLIGDKNIYDIAFDGANAYLACGFGVLNINLSRAEAVYTTFTDTPVKAIATLDNTLFAGTEEGLFQIPIDDPNPADFSRWVPAAPASGLPQGLPISALATKANRLLIGVEQSLWALENQTASLVATHPERSVSFITTEGAGTLIGWRAGNQGSLEYMRQDGSRSEIHYACEAYNPLHALEDNHQKCWIADPGERFKWFDLTTNSCNSFTFNSPLNHKSAEISIGADGTTYVATPGPTPNLGPPYFPDGLYVYKQGNWDLWNKNTFPALVDDEISWVDWWRVAPHPNLNRVFVGSWVGGLLEFNDNTYTRKLTKKNSILLDAGASGTNRTAIGGIAFDKSGNLWISNYGATAPMALLKPDGTLRNFSGSPVQGLLQVAVDAYNYKWCTIAFNGGIMVYDSGSNPDSPTDDQYKIFNTANSVLPTNTVNCVSVDLDGDVWVGTQQGVVSFECGSNVFKDVCTGRRRIVSSDNFNGYLLETEDVKCIAIDGANRKWFGTTNGVFVQSPDGLTQIANFTSTNSPLFDNNITDIAVNPKTGEAWIGTEKGLISLRTEAVAGGSLHNPSAYAYPNPVRPDYDGPIAIYGLARDANIKITDVAGNLIHEGQALGGQAVWDGRDYTGKPASSGVYLIFATSNATFDTPDTIIVKLVIVR
jgi:ligand-binding sensor domain-containing protein